MPAPPSYTEDELKTFMVNELGATGTALGLTTSSALITQAVTAVVRLIGKAIADETDMALLEAGARWKAWEAADAVAIGQYDLKAGTAQLSRSQVWEHIQARLPVARSAWFTELARVNAANGTAPAFFGFSTICGRRGR